MSIINYDITKKIAKLIQENQDLPIVTLVGYEANDVGYGYIASDDVTVAIGEVCDYSFPMEKVYTDREELADDLYEYYINSFDGTEREFDEYIDKKIMKYEQYWIKCIIIYVD